MNGTVMKVIMYWTIGVTVVGLGHHFVGGKLAYWVVGIVVAALALDTLTSRSRHQ